MVPGLGTQALAKSVLDFADLTLEELMRETITSVSKRPQALADAASAVTVITGDELRRSGAVHLADALRGVPGLQVSTVNSNQWAVASRGFRAVYTNKLLVMVDGRPVYSPAFSGVFWELQQTPLEDIERIEIIRGPGATIWGSNAVNGVINIVSSDARDTQGGFVSVGVGDVERSLIVARHGGQIAENTYYRVFASRKERDDFPLADGSSAGDEWRAEHGGFRIDHHASESSHLTWQADTTNLVYDSPRELYNVNTLARLRRETGPEAGFQIQASFDYTSSADSSTARSQTRSYDLSFERTQVLSERNTLVWGLGYRYSHSGFSTTNPAVLLRREAVDQHLYGAFVQNEFA